MKIVFLDTNSVGDADLSALSQQGELKCYSTNESSVDTEELLQDCEVVISNKVVLNEQLIRNAPNLKLICVAATGYNNIDIVAAKAHGVTVCNVAGYSTQSVAQHVFAMLLNWAIQLQSYHNASVQGEWAQSELFCLLDYPIFELTGKTLGIIGYGDIGQAVAKLAQAFGMTVMIAERDGYPARDGRVKFEQVIKQADVISLHCPLNNETSNMVDSAFLAQMKSDAILINTARGGLIDELALATVLDAKHIQAALLDGLATEPPTAHHPLLKPRDNLVLTPHTAWASKQARQTLVNEIAENINAFKQGHIRNCIV